MQDEAARLHDACSQSLEGVVETSQLAIHCEKAGRHERAAQLFYASGIALNLDGVSPWARGFVRRTGFPEVPVRPAYRN